MVRYKFLEGLPQCAGMYVGEKSKSAGDPPIAKKDLCNAKDHGGASQAVTAARRSLCGVFVDRSQVNVDYAWERQTRSPDNWCWERSGWAWQKQRGHLFVGVGCYEAVAKCQGSAVTSAPSQQGRGPCLDPLRLMTYNANGLFAVTSGPEYKYCKLSKTANKLRSVAVLIGETHVNGLVDWQVIDAELGAPRYGHTIF